MAYIYVASSWKNPYQPPVVERLRSAGHDVYDFRNPAPGNTGFQWSNIDPHWEQWTSDQYINALHTRYAQDGYQLDYDALINADATLMVLPCGKSAHLELGTACGLGQQTAILMLERDTPELMYKLANTIITSWGSLDEWLARLY